MRMLTLSSRLLLFPLFFFLLLTNSRYLYATGPRDLVQVRSEYGPSQT